MCALYMQVKLKFYERKGLPLTDELKAKVRQSAAHHVMYISIYLPPLYCRKQSWSRKRVEMSGTVWERR